MMINSALFTIQIFDCFLKYFHAIQTVWDIIIFLFCYVMIVLA